MDNPIRALSQKDMWDLNRDNRGWKPGETIDVCAGCHWCLDMDETRFICRNLAPKKILRQKSTGVRLLCDGMKQKGWKEPKYGRQ